MEREQPPAGPTMLSDEQRTLLATVLNVLIPPRGDLPGAGDLGVGGVIERALAAAPALRRPVLDALAAIEGATARRHAGAAFAALALDQQETVLREVERRAPSLFAVLLTQTYRGYYTDPRVLAAIGVDGRPPQPRGHDLPAFDPALLERQRQRAPFWRPTA
jgi:hypothetical protein